MKKRVEAVSVDVTTAVHPLGEADSALVLTVSRFDGKPATLGPKGLERLRGAVEEACELAIAEGHGAIVLTGVGETFLAGADLDYVSSTRQPAVARALGEAGHRLIAALLDAPVPTVAWINGTALGGGYEIALACRLRIAHKEARAIGLPEVHLGLIPGWGGCYLLPHLIGPAAAARLIVDGPLKARTSYGALGAAQLGLVDAVSECEGFPAEEISALLAHPPRHAAPTTTELSAPEWRQELAPSLERARRAAHAGRPAPLLALELLAAAPGQRGPAFAREDEALATLIASDALHDTLHATALLRRARPPRGATTPVRRLGVLGGGLMATQLATALSQSLKIPVHLVEVDESGAARTRQLLAAAYSQLAARPTPPPSAELEALAGRLTVGTEVGALADADLVIEAVYEDLEVKRQVFAAVEPHLREGAILATNTSALSIKQLGAQLADPARLVGIHFFNPVAAMPLVEIVSGPLTDPAVHTAARAFVEAAGKTVVEVSDAPGFIVNRILLRLLAEVLAALEDGTDLATAASALDPIGLPMGPLQLLQLVGPAVAQHVLRTLHEQLGPRYRLSRGLAALQRDGVPFTLGPPSPTAPVNPQVAHYFPPGPTTAQEVLHRTLLALSDEISRMIDEGVASRDSIDVAMILGARWPLHRGGITRYLDELAEETGSPVRFH